MIDALKNMKIPERLLFSSDNRVDIITDFMKVKFPIFMQFPPKNIEQPITIQDSTKHPRLSKETIEAIKYHNELCEKSEEELLVLRDKARTKKDAVYFDSKADFQHWGKLGLWTVEQGIALLLGMNPEIVNFGVMKERLYSPKAIKFKQYMELANSDLKISDITGMKTENLLKWAADHDLSIPPELQNVVDKYHKLLDWKEKYEQEKIRADELQVKLDNILLNKSDIQQNATDIISDKNKSTLLWLLGVCLHKGWKNSFNANDKGNSLAEHIFTYIEKNPELNPKIKKPAIATAIRESREAVIGSTGEIIDKAITATQKKKNT